MLCIEDRQFLKKTNTFLKTLKSDHINFFQTRKTRRENEMYE